MGHRGTNVTNYFMYWRARYVCCPPPLSFHWLRQFLHFNQAFIQNLIGNLANIHPCPIWDIIEGTFNVWMNCGALHNRIVDYLQSLPRPIQGGFIFEHRCWNRKAFVEALSLTGIEDFTFHDLRHCAINNLRLAGNDHYKIKQASGQKTESAFLR